MFQVQVRSAEMTRALLKLAATKAAVHRQTRSRASLRLDWFRLIAVGPALRAERQLRRNLTLNPGEGWISANAEGDLCPRTVVMERY